MLIRCKLIRSGGTSIEVKGQSYHFAPSPEGHICTVEDVEHINILLGIPEAYEEVVAATLGGDLPPPIFNDKEFGAIAIDNHDLDDLRDRVYQKTGIRPHHRAGRDKLLALLS